LTGNKKPQAKGRTDQTIGQVKNAADKATGKVVDKIRD